MAPPTVIENPTQTPGFGKEAKSSTTVGDNNYDYQFHLQKVVDKLKNDPTTVTADDARRLHEHFNATDKESARLISAIEAVANANGELASVQGDTEALAKSGHTSLTTIAEDLLHAVESNPGDVTVEVLKLTQTAVSKMQKAIGTANAPHPELEATLLEEYAKMEPKVEQGTVTKAEADHLHSLEARAHGHTEKGGLTAVAQSVAAKRERQHSLSEDRSGSSNPYYNTYMSPPYNNFHGITPAENSVKDQAANPRQIEMVLRPKIEKEPEHVTKEGAAAVKCYGHHGSGDIENESPPTKTQCSADKNKTKIVVLED